MIRFTLCKDSFLLGVYRMDDKWLIMVPFVIIDFPGKVDDAVVLSSNDA